MTVAVRSPQIVPAPPPPALLRPVFPSCALLCLSASTLDSQKATPMFYVCSIITQPTSVCPLCNPDPCSHESTNALSPVLHTMPMENPQATVTLVTTEFSPGHSVTTAQGPLGDVASRSQIQARYHLTPARPQSPLFVMQITDPQNYTEFKY